MPRAHHDRPPVARGESLEGRDVRMPRPEAARYHAGHQVVGERVLEDRELTVEHRDVDHRPRTGVAPREERTRDADGEEQARGDVADRDTDPRRRLIGVAGEAQDPAHRLGDHVERRALAQWAGVPEAGHRGIDEPRPARVERRPAVAEPLERARPEVLDQDVRRAE